MYLMVGKKRVLDIENYRQEVIKKIQALHYNQQLVLGLTAFFIQIFY